MHSKQKLLPTAFLALSAASFSAAESNGQLPSPSPYAPPSLAFPPRQVSGADAADIAKDFLQLAPSAVVVGAASAGLLSLMLRRDRSSRPQR